jgi:hypothetical protein
MTRVPRHPAPSRRGSAMHAADRPSVAISTALVEGPYRVHRCRPRDHGPGERHLKASTGSASDERPDAPHPPIRNRWGANAGTDPGPVTIELTTRMLRSARLLGPATLDVEGRAGQCRIHGRGQHAPRHPPRRRRALAWPARRGSLDWRVPPRPCAASSGTGSVAAASLAASTATITANTAGAVALG